LDVALALAMFGCCFSFSDLLDVALALAFFGCCFSFSDFWILR
jgi:hypothetical protein